MADYTYDVFLSWRRADPVLRWFQRYFRPEFEARLASTLGHAPRIFVDERDVRLGEVWPKKIKDALRGSRVLVAVWEPQYFRSAWCRAELESMDRRQAVHEGSRLVLPVVVKDGHHFKDWTDRLQYRRFESLLTGADAFRHSPEYLRLVREIDTLCEEVESALTTAPPWSADFPVVEPEPLPAAPAAPLPRFR